MPINIEDEETEQLARKLARMTGETVTEAIRSAIEEKYHRLQRARSRRTIADELNEIALRCASRPVISTLTDDEILGYDEFGAPTK